MSHVKTEYKTVHYRMLEALEQEVTELIEEGWEPIGGVSGIYHGEGSYGFVQAMIRRTAPPPRRKKVGAKNENRAQR